MKKIIRHLSIAIVLLFTIHASLFTAFGQNTTRYFIQFTDKGNNTYDLSHPDSFLTARAILRRTNQGIGYDSLDLPVTQMYIDSVAARGASILFPTKWLNGVTVTITDTNVLNAVLALPFVYQATNPVGRKREQGMRYEPIGLIQTESLLSISNPSNQRIKSVTAIDYGQGTQQIQLIHGDFLHSLGFMGEGKVIC